MFNLFYYTGFQNTITLLQELSLLLTADKEHKKVFAGVAVVGFHTG